MTFADGILVIGAAFVGGLVNAMAGGGTMFTFPALLMLGLDPRAANATSTLALMPGSLSGAWGFRAHIKSHAEARHRLLVLSLISLVGGALGAYLLLVTPKEVFKRIVPCLILFATLLFMRQRNRDEDAFREGPHSRAWQAFALLFQFLVAVYGGYFGAGAGILTLASLAFHRVHDIQEANGIKNLLVFCMNTLAAVCFSFFGLVHWPEALCMAVATMAGGYGASRVAHRIGRQRVRAFVIATGFVVTLATLWHALT